MLRRLVRLSLQIVGSLVVLVLWTAPAYAHGVLEDSDPRDGATLAEAPRRVTLHFSEEISDRFSTARLVSADGQQVEGTAEAPNDVPRDVILNLPALAGGTYGVIWQVLSTDDGHVTHGTITFSVGAPSGQVVVGSEDATSSTATAGGSSSSLSTVTRRWLSIGLLAGVVGTLTMAGPVLEAARRRSRDAVVDDAVRRARPRLLVICALCTTGAFALGISALMTRAAQLAPLPGSVAATAWDVVVQTRWGHLWVLSELALALVAVLVWRVHQGSGRATTPVVAALAALVVVIVVAEALSSHAAALSSWQPLAVAADGVHILAALMWLGLVACLAVTAWGVTLSGPERAAVLRACRWPFSVLAATSVAAIVVTGLYSAGREVATVSDVSGTAYGRTLLVKVALLGGLALLGLANNRRLHAASVGLSRRAVVAEVVLGAVLLAAVAVLVETPPARSPDGGSSAEAAAVTSRSWSGAKDDLVVTVSVSPNRTGINGFTVSAASSRRPPPAEVDSVALVLPTLGGQTISLNKTAQGQWFGTGRLDELGPLAAQARIGRGGTVVDVPVPVTVGATDVSADEAAEGTEQPAARRSLASFVNPLAVAVLVLSLAGAVVLRRRRDDADDPLGADDAADAAAMAVAAEVQKVGEGL